MSERESQGAASSDPLLRVLEEMREYAEREGVGLIYTGSDLDDDDMALLKEVWPRLIVRDHADPDNIRTEGGHAR